MSQYNELFLDAKTNQYGSHMIMTNVHKQEKKKYVNIDTKFREEYNYLQTANYNILLPEKITDVKTLTITNIEIPISYFNISTNLGNNTCKITNPTNSVSQIFTIPDGQYGTQNQLQSAFNSAITSLPYPFSNLNYTYNANTNNSNQSGFSLINNSVPALTIDFAVDASGNTDKYNFKNKLGWLLGYRNTSYTITSTSITLSESFVDLNGPRYLYLALEEFNKGNQKSFITPLFNSVINKNIIARISIDNATHGYQTILPANSHNGLLKSDVRSYTGKIDLQKINLQLLNESGIPINLNGADFSVLMEIVHE